MPGGHWVVMDCCSNMLERMLRSWKLGEYDYEMNNGVQLLGIINGRI